MSRKLFLGVASDPCIKTGSSLTEQLIMLKSNSGSIMNEELVARYCYLLPDQYADRQLLNDISPFINYIFHDNIDDMRHELNDNITLDRERELRYTHFRRDICPYETTMLKNYYKRQGLNPARELIYRCGFIVNK